MIKTVLKFIDYMELKYKISIPKEPLIEFAKEIIGNLLRLLPDEVLYHDFYNRTYVAPAEQFLNSEVEK